MTKPWQSALRQIRLLRRGACESGAGRPVADQAPPGPGIDSKPTGL
jgi:hypothetical protein